MARLFSYVIPVDDGAAPNPFWGVCTLTICKPQIRRAAQIGDWVIGVGSKRAPQGDLSGTLVYAMRVTGKMTLEEYDEYCRAELRQKIPAWHHRDWRRRLGDCIYDYSSGRRPRIRQGVHDSHNRKRDLGGRFALLSRDFYYFGDHPLALPRSLQAIAPPQQGHRSNANSKQMRPFLRWLARRELKRNGLFGSPQYPLFDDQEEGVPTLRSRRSKCGGPSRKKAC